MKVSFSDIEDAYLTGHDESLHWLDLATGEVLFWDDEVAGYAERGGDLGALPE